MRGVETMLGPEMKSTGEVLGIDGTYAGALRKGFIGAGIRLPKDGGRVLVSISNEEKPAAVDLMRRLAALGNTLVATPGTHDWLTENSIVAERVAPIGGGSPDVLEVIGRREVDLVINDFRAGRSQQTDNYRIRRAAVEASIASLTFAGYCTCARHGARVRSGTAAFAPRVSGLAPRCSEAISAHTPRRPRRCGRDALKRLRPRTRSAQRHALRRGAEFVFRRRDRRFAGRSMHSTGRPSPYLVQLPAGVALRAVRDVYYFFPGPRRSR